MDYEKEFLEGKLAVNCRSKRQAEKFEEYCNKNIEKIINTNIVNMWIYGAATCYHLDNDMTNLITTGKRQEYENSGLKVVTYKEFMSDIRAEQQDDKEIAKMVQERDKKDDGTRYSLEDIKKIMKQEYTFAEVVSRIKEGEEYICTEPLYNIRSIKKYKTGVHFEFEHFNGDKYVNEAGIGDKTRFILKQREYMNFENAAMSGKKFKYKDTDDFKTLKEIVLDLNKMCENGWTISDMLNEKAWEVEE